MCLPNARRAQKQRRDLVPHEPQRAQLGEPLRVQLRLERDVELVQRLVVRQPGGLQAGGVAAFEHADLALEHEVEELAVAELPVLGAADQLIGGVGESVELQLAGVCGGCARRSAHHRVAVGCDRSAPQVLHGLSSDLKTS